MIRREDLERIKKAASRSGFRFRDAAGVDMMLYGNTGSAKNTVRLIFSNEKVRPNQVVSNPPMAPERMDAAGLITPEVEEKLPAILLERLRHVRETE
jgi:hypothetical protein